MKILSIAGETGSKRLDALLADIESKWWLNGGSTIYLSPHQLKDALQHAYTIGFHESEDSMMDRKTISSPEPIDQTP
jgi:hypothetical protein